jgi:hypothetical protein
MGCFGWRLWYYGRSAVLDCVLCQCRAFFGGRWVGSGAVMLEGLSLPRKVVGMVSCSEGRSLPHKAELSGVLSVTESMSEEGQSLPRDRVLRSLFWSIVSYDGA